MNGMSPRMKFPVAAAAAIVLLMTCTWAIADWTVATPAERARPSFDCGKAMERAEKLVCASQELSALDRDLRQAYTSAVMHLEAGKAALKKEQRNWVRYVRNICLTDECLHRAYQARIEVLHRNERVIVDDVGACSDFGARECDGVVFYRDPTIELGRFNKSMKESGKQGEILTCERLLDLPVGSVRGNHSFGGYCTLRTGSTRQKVIICNDLMIGHFAIDSVGAEQPSDKMLVQFTADHCFGG